MHAIQHRQEHGVIELPGPLWIRSPHLPEYALCLDPEAAFFGWKMIENEAYKSWSSISRLTAAEVAQCLEYEGFAEFRSQLEILRERMDTELRQRELAEQRRFLEGADLADDADLEDEPYCVCAAEHSFEEEDTNQCDCCGKALS